MSSRPVEGLAVFPRQLEARSGPCPDRIDSLIEAASHSAAEPDKSALTSTWAPSVLAGSSSENFMSRSRPSSVRSLKVDPAEHASRWKPRACARQASYASIRRGKAIEIASVTGDRLAALPSTFPAFAKSIKIADNGIRSYFAGVEMRLMQRRDRARAPLRVRPR